MAEKVARLDKEQWDTLKAVLDGEIADLLCQLQQAQQDLAKERENGLREANACEQARLAALRAHDDLAEAQAERDAAIERAEIAEGERDARWTEAEAKDEVAEVLEVAAIHVAEQRALLDRLFEYVMVQEGGFKDVLLANEVADYLGPAEAQARQKEDSDESSHVGDASHL